MTTSVRAAVLAALAFTTSEALAQHPIVELTKSCPNLRYVGRDASFEITVSNRGDAAAQNVVVTDMLPGGIDFLNLDNGGVREGNNLVWRIGTLEAGQSRVLQAHFRCNTIGTFTNSAKVSYCVESTAECRLEVKGIPAILLECVDDPDPNELGSNLTYTITVTNQGSAVDTNIGVACTLPPELEYVSDTGPTAASVAGNKVTFAPLPSLPPKAKAVYKLTVKGVGEGDVRFRVDMTSDNLGSPVMETESTHIYK
jgi:uncharacterized repeat protein (TIGR01451 family)